MINCKKCGIAIKKKDSYTCHNCGLVFCGKHSYQYVDENNRAITQHSPILCGDCYYARYNKGLE
jgi:uncharacterized membrane protein YvbJ